MYDLTPYESTHPARLEQSANIAIGRIVEVNVQHRTCTVATISGRGSIFDQYIENVPWLSPDVNPEGDEMGSVPRSGSLGLVFFVDGQVFIGGFFRPIGDQATTIRGNEEARLVQGDKIISTLSGNRVTVKRSGLIEMYVAENLKRLLLPTSGQLIDKCRTYGLEADGGFLSWKFDKILNTLFTAEYYSSAARLFLIEEKKGYVSGSLIYSKTIGPGIPGIKGTELPVFKQTTSITGETITEVHPPLPEGSPIGYKSTIGPDGSVEILAGTAQTVKATIGPTGATEIDVNKLVKVSMSETGDFEAKGPIGSLAIAKTGDIDAKNAVAGLSIDKTGNVEAKNSTASISMKTSGEITIKNSTVTVTIAPSGEVKIDAPNKVAIESKAGVDIKSLGPVNIEGAGPMNLKTKGQVMIDGGSGASDFVLTNPTTLSPFTGSPLAPFSTTVLVSK